MLEQTVEVRSGDVRLEGTLVLSIPGDPGPHPAALLLSGSGPLDRDSNIATATPSTSPDLAAGLSLQHHGVASLRYDKRGVGMSEGQVAIASLSDETADACCALEALRARPESLVGVR